MKDKMTWEETIEFIRDKEEYKGLVERAYFERDLLLNIERFRSGEEYKECLKYIKTFAPNAKKILDIGCGNGISCISLALDGYDVTAVEPEPSETIGAGAIRKLKEHYKLDNLEIFEAFAEDINFEDESFDIVYIRQAMHHANDLDKFIKECGRVLKKGGMLFTVRDHVIFNEKDKQWFFEAHPLHKYYGGENAYKPGEYESAMENAGLEIQEKLKYFDSIINYFPMTKDQYDLLEVEFELNLKKGLGSKIGVLSKIPFLYNLYKNKNKGNLRNEMHIAGRMYSYISIKK